MPPPEVERWLRDTEALIALPALWVDREPAEIVRGMLLVLSSMLALDASHARFDDPGGGPALEAWNPAVARPSISRTVETTVPVALPWVTGRVTVSAARDGFPTEVEWHLLRFAVSQGAIAIHTARRLAEENEAAAAVGRSATRRDDRSRVRDVPVPTASPPPPLTPREGEVLGLVAEGLSNKQIAGAMWLSDRTVERHLTSVYRKIGVARRSEATAFALRHGVVPV